MDLNIQNWEWWENCRQIFRKVAIKHSLKRSVNFQKQMNELEEALTQIDCLIRGCDDSDL